MITTLNQESTGWVILWQIRTYTRYNKLKLRRM